MRTPCAREVATEAGAPSFAATCEGLSALYEHVAREQAVELPEEQLFALADVHVLERGLGYPTGEGPDRRLLCSIEGARDRGGHLPLGRGTRNRGDRDGSDDTPWLAGDHFWGLRGST